MLNKLNTCITAFSLVVSAMAMADSSPGEAPIHLQARLGTASEVKSLLKAEPAARDLRTALGSTPLHLAAMNPDTGALQSLLMAGADPNARDLNGATPLHMAAYASHEIVLGDVIRQTENDFNLVECFVKDSNCRLQQACRLHGILDTALSAMFLVLDGYTLADLVSRTQIDLGNIHTPRLA